MPGVLVMEALAQAACCCIFSDPEREVGVGYFAGIAAKLVSGNINWVLAVYLINLVFLGCNWGVYFRNRRLDATRSATCPCEPATLFPESR